MSFSQHAAFAFLQGWSALKFEWYKYASWISFIKGSTKEINISNNNISSSNYKSLISENQAIQFDSVGCNIVSLLK